MLRFDRVLAAIMLCGMMAGNVAAVTSDTFTITVTCNFIGINLRTHDNASDYATWAIGQLGVGQSVSMTETQGIMVVNTANINTNLSARISTEAGAWTAGNAAGANTYRLELKAFDATQAAPDMAAGTTSIIATASAGNVFESNLPGFTNQWVYGRFTLPTSTSTGAQQTITVTILASAS
ncbi:MAG TPA: hypothetical protein VLH60_06930, partial [Sedimentisphaerales bacterium]|nr:hypothetical protein [Sedimentisphaerales bacterium]